MRVSILRASRGVVHSGDPVSAPIDLVFDDRVESSCWTRGPRPLKGRLLSFNIAAFSLLLAWIARGQIGVAVGFALAGIAGWFLSRTIGMRPLHRLDGEVRQTTSAAGARTLLATLRERKSVEWFAPANFTPLMEGRLQLRIGDFRAAAAAYARAGQASVAPTAARSMHAAQAHALVMAGDHKEALAQLSDLGDLEDFDPQVRLDLAIAKLSIPGSMKGVVEELEALEGGLAAHPRALAAKSVALHREGDTDGAIACFERLAAHDSKGDPVVHALVKRARKSLRGELKAREKAARQQQAQEDQSVEGAASLKEAPVTSSTAPAAPVPSKRRKGKPSKSDKRAKKEARRRERQDAKAKAKAAKHAARQAAHSDRTVNVPPASPASQAAPSGTPKVGPSVAARLPSLPSLSKLSEQRGATSLGSTSSSPKAEVKSGSQILAGLPPLRAAKVPTAASAPTPTPKPALTPKPATAPKPAPTPKPATAPAPSSSPRAVKPSLAAALSNPLGSKGAGAPSPGKAGVSIPRPVSPLLNPEKIAPATLPDASSPSPKVPVKAARSLPDLPPIPSLPSVPAAPSPSAPKPASPASTPSWASLLDDLPSAPAPSAPAPSAPKKSDD